MKMRYLLQAKNRTTMGTVRNLNAEERTFICKKRKTTRYFRAIC